MRIDDVAGNMCLTLSRGAAAADSVAAVGGAGSRAPVATG